MHVSVFMLAGLTATGKSAVAHALARAMGASVLSADSMLVYRGMDIGTAKVSAAERREVPYDGLDLVDPWDTFDTHAYLAHARGALGAAHAQLRPVVVTGGTGLYLAALLRGLDARPGADPVERARWRELHGTGGVAVLQAAAAERIPVAFAALNESDRCNPRRLMRLLETGGRAATPMPRPPLPPIPALVMAPDKLRRVVSARVDAMVTAGLEREVAGLLATGRPLSPTARQAIGYAEWAQVLAGRCTPDEARERMVARTMQLAKKQRTWLRHQLAVEWIEVDPRDPLPDIAGRVAACWRRTGPVPTAVEPGEPRD